MRPRVTIDRTDKITGKRTSKVELFFYSNGLLIHRHSFVEDTKENRELFPVHRKFGNRLYTTQELIMCPDEVKEALRLFTIKDAKVLFGRFFRNNFLTRVLWRLTLKVTMIWQKRKLK